MEDATGTSGDGNPTSKVVADGAQRRTLADNGGNFGTVSRRDTNLDD